MVLHVQNFLCQLDRVKPVPAQKHAESYTALCPAHNDRNPSLCVDVTHDGRILLYCRAGCGAGDVLAATGLSMSDLFPGNNYQRPPGYTTKEIDYALTVARVAEQYRRNGAKPKLSDLEIINQALKVLNRTKSLILREARRAR